MGAGTVLGRDAGNKRPNQEAKAASRPGLGPWRGIQENGRSGVFQRHGASKTKVEDGKRRLWDSRASGPCSRAALTEQWATVEKQAWGGEVTPVFQWRVEWQERCINLIVRGPR